MKRGRGLFDSLKNSSKYLGTAAKYAGMIDHPLAQQIAGYADKGSKVASALGYGRKRRRGGMMPGGPSRVLANLAAARARRSS
jgi:hypothetical protein